MVMDLAAKTISSFLPAQLLVNKRYFRLWESKGYHIAPVHFDEPLPDTRTLNDRLWASGSELVGFDMNEKKQLGLMSLFRARFKVEYDALPKQQTSAPWQYYSCNPFFGPVDGEILYCIIRHFKPRRIMEIGSGYSTLLSA
jgi:hypothetical protein